MAQNKLRIKGVNTGGGGNLTDFISVWNTTLGDSNPLIVLPLVSSGNYNFIVNWGDGNTDTITTWDQAEVLHNYATGGIYTVTITGTIEGWQFNYGQDCEKLTSITNIGQLKLGNEGAYFAGCSNLTTIGGVFDLTGTTNFTSMFQDCTSLTSINGIGSWDVSSVTNMDGMFNQTTAFNQPLNSWDVSSVIDMNYMFANAAAFNQDISGWDVSSVTNMGGMFAGTSAFNQPLNSWNTAAVTNMGGMFGSTKDNSSIFNQPLNLWNTSAVTDMVGMFSGNQYFNQDIGAWNTTAVTNMGGMFDGATTFNQDIGGWDVSSVTSMGGMFDTATAFNQDISGWDVSAVTTMSSMFNGTPFNQSLDSWDVSSVTSMNNMFAYATSFDQDISGWDVSNVQYMIGTFEGATAFNQDISSWDISNVVDMDAFMYGKTTADYSYYDNLLNAWSQLTLQNYGNLGMGTIEYTSAGATARQDIIDNYGWNISDGGELIPTLSYNVSYDDGTLTQTQINNITGQSPTIRLIRYTGPGFIMSETSISSIGNLTQVSGNLFTSTFNQSDLLDILVDGAYYNIGGLDNYSTGYSTESPYYDGSSGDYFIKWNESAGKFYSASSLSQYNPVTGGNLIFNDYEVGDALYNEIDPLTDTLEFFAGLPK